MKALILTFMVFFSAASFAGGKMVIEGKKYTCQQLKAAVQHYGAVYIRSWGTRRYVASQSFCGRRERAVHANVPSKDKMFCNAGLICQKIKSSDD